MREDGRSASAESPTPAYMVGSVARLGLLGLLCCKHVGHKPHLLDPLVVLAGIITVLDEGMPRDPGASLADQSLKRERTANPTIQIVIEIKIENQLP